VSAPLTHLMLFALPALTLWLTLARGRYPGERMLARIARARRGPRLKAAAAPMLPAAPAALRGARDRLAGSLVGRAPPPRATATKLCTI
jgi:hypothetical protein